MPVRPALQRFECLECRWHKVTAPRSDALIRGVDFFDVCPHCKNENLVAKPLSFT
ncbi:hypothetical protein ABN306_04345 [Providencia huaxiensis]|uniref:hypothetical protein n=1 Tax=Providencia huaxiensis TaxID=2027290 RepID=UPI0032D9E92C